MSVGNLGAGNIRSDIRQVGITLPIGESKVGVLPNNPNRNFLHILNTSGIMARLMFGRPCTGGVDDYQLQPGDNILYQGQVPQNSLNVMNGSAGEVTGVVNLVILEGRLPQEMLDAQR